MFAFFKTLDRVSKKETDFLEEMGVPNVTISKFSYKQESEDVESRIIAVDDLQVWEIYKQGGKILQRGLKLDERSNFNAYKYLMGRHAQRMLEIFVQESSNMVDESLAFFSFKH